MAHEGMFINCTDNYFYENNDSVTARNLGHFSITPEPPLYVVVTTTVFYAFIFLIGVLGNILVIYVVCRNREMRNSTNFFLVNLSVADLLVIIVCMPTALIDIYARENWYFGGAMCKLIPLMENTVAFASVLTIIAISFERYYAICHPLKAQYTCTLSRMIKIVACVWLVAFLASCPFFKIAIYRDSKFKDGTPIKVCRLPIKEPWQKAYVIIAAVFFFLLPLILLIGLYGVISQKLMRDSQIRDAKQQRVVKSNANSRKQVVLMLFIVVMLFFVCLIPARVIILWATFASAEQLLQLGFVGYLNVTYFARVMLYLNSATNPVVYNMVSTKFRDSFRRALGIKQRQQLFRQRTLSSHIYNEHPV